MGNLEKPGGIPCSDTTPDAEGVQIQLLREASPTRRFGLARSLSATVIGLSRRGLQARSGELNIISVLLRLAGVMYGKELARGLSERIGSDPTEFAMTPPDILEALAPVAAALEEIGVEYYLVGSIASSVRGVPRSTVDIDLVAGLELDEVAPLVSKLESSYYVDGDAAKDAVRRKGSFNLIHLRTMLKVDVFVSKGRPFDREVQRRATGQALDEAPGARTFPVASAEDTVLSKLEWYRAGNELSEQQRRDVLGIIKVCGPQLDREYLEHWAGQLRIRDLLRRALGEAELA